VNFSVEKSQSKRSAHLSKSALISHCHTVVELKPVKHSHICDLQESSSR